MSINKFNSKNAPDPVGLYPHARKIGDLLFLSGVGPRERGKKEIPGVELDDNGLRVYDPIPNQWLFTINEISTGSSGYECEGEVQLIGGQ